MSACTQDDGAVSVVIIGRNEGARLGRCIESVLAAHTLGQLCELIYVDSASSDGSAERATALGARVIHIKPGQLCAAAARNAGWRAARGQFVLFLDGDTVLAPAFLGQALAAMARAQVGVVWGHRRELAPHQSVYVRVLDLDWVYAPGMTDFCGGDALVRRSLLDTLGGFDATLIAGEEPELCSRVRESGVQILHLDVPMTGHDLAIRSFRAYWARAFRAGHAYAEVARRCRHRPGRFWQRETHRNQLHGVLVAGMPIWLAAALVVHPMLVLALGLAGVGLLTRSVLLSRWKCGDTGTRVLYALHSHFQQVPILAGQLGYWLDRIVRRRRSLIEYKGEQP